MHRKYPFLATAILVTAALACSAPGATPPTPTFYEIFPAGTEQSSITGTPPAGGSTVQDILAFYPLAKGAVWTYHVVTHTELSPGEATDWNGDVTMTVTDVRTEGDALIVTADWTGRPDLASV